MGLAENVAIGFLTAVIAGIWRTNDFPGTSLAKLAVICAFMAASVLIFVNFIGK